MNILCLILGLIFGCIAGVTLVEHPQPQPQRASPISAETSQEESDDPEEPITIQAPYGQSLPPRPRNRGYSSETGEEGTVIRYGPPVRACRGGCYGR
jgi:hypothetical protein